jgi:hypothetical protein
MKKKQLYIGILSVACCALVAIGITLHLLVEESRAIGFRMGRNLAIGWNRIVYESCQTVSLHLISALCIGFHTVESIAHDDASHSLSFLIS